ncbi:cytochrome P450, partial [Punctularia strigosozonata HHB-11173 SS5]|uniref:cytochrome P450 n=1 Tax=Punctularia strigosozonata (strain HHB-11173) TaxID=741275 RepID=UPI0004416E8E
GSDTTSGVMILLLYHLLANRATYDRLMEELNAHCEKGKISEDTVFKLPYLGAVVNEGIRLGTPFPGLPRVVPKGGTVLCGTYIPENTVVSVPAYSQHIHPDNFWPEPEKFRPERWLPGGLGPRSILRTSALMSFSYGPFGCLGRTLAIRELQILTVYLLRSFDIRLAGSFDEQRFVRGVLNMRTTVFEYPLLVDIQQRV